MEELVLVCLAGFGATLVDGSLGMGFGPTSATLLMAGGMSPAATSATVNIAKVATGIAGAASHWRLGNVDRRLVVALAGPGVVGAAIGATVLTMIDGEHLRPLLALMLVGAGLRIVWRFLGGAPGGEAERDADHIDLATRATGAVGGLTNGLIGAWGPVVTPFLLHRGVAPRRAIGSVNTAEVAVAVVSVGALARSWSDEGLDAGIVVAMLVGGVVAAPLAASLVRVLPARPLGLAVGAALVASQLGELVTAGWVPGGWPTILAVGALAAGCLTAGRSRVSGAPTRRGRRRSHARSRASDPTARRRA